MDTTPGGRTRMMMIRNQYFVIARKKSKTTAIISRVKI